MEPAGASSMFMAEWPNSERVSIKSALFPLHVSKSNQTTCSWLLMKVVPRGQDQDTLRSTLWSPRPLFRQSGMDSWDVIDDRIDSTRTRRADRWNGDNGVPLVARKTIPRDPDLDANLSVARNLGHFLETLKQFRDKWQLREPFEKRVGDILSRRQRKRRTKRRESLFSGI